MSTSATQIAPTALIVGCGYLGKPLARLLLRQGGEVYGTTRHPARAAALAQMGIRPLLVSVNQSVTFAAMTPALEAPSLDVYYMVPPAPGSSPGSEPGHHQVGMQGISQITRALRRANVRKSILVSSTAVYGYRDGRTVTADTPARPSDPRGQLLYDGEQCWLGQGENHHVLRLAGIYGPERIIGRQAILNGAPIVGDPDLMLNLIHVDDACGLLMAMMRSDRIGRIELGADGRAVRRIEYYRYLANKLGAAEPRVLDNQAALALGMDLDRLARVTNRVCDVSQTCLRTGWHPRYPDFRHGLDALLSQPV